MAGPSISTSSAADNRVAATDSAKVVQAKGNTQYTEAGALSVGEKGTMVQGQGVNLAGTNAKGNISVSTSDPAVLQAALDAVTANNHAALTAIANTQAGAGGLVNSALDSLAQTTETAQSGGASIAANSIQKILLWGLGIVGLVVVLVVWARARKKA